MAHWPLNWGGGAALAPFRGFGGSAPENPFPGFGAEPRTLHSV